jgi:NAD+ synthase
VFGLHLPERESSPDTARLSRLVSDTLGIDSAYDDITGVLEALGCYRRRDAAIRMVCPEYAAGWRAKIVLPEVVDSDAFRLYSVVVQAPDGTELRHRLTPESYLGIVAATGYKQRVRKMLEHYHADRLNYLTTASADRLKHDQGSFVKLGDGAGDIKPIAHLYRTQVHAMAAFLGVPDAVRARPSTSDTYPLPQSVEEGYFAVPWEQLDLCLYAKNHRLPVAAVARATGLTEEQVQRVYRDIDQKRASTRHLHLAPRLVERVDPISS